MTLTEKWEEHGRPRPPFLYLFDHPDEWRNQWRKVDYVGMLDCATIFRDDSGEFNGDLLKVRYLTRNVKASEAELELLADSVL